MDDFMDDFDDDGFGDDGDSQDDDFDDPLDLNDCDLDDDWCGADDEEPDAVLDDAYNQEADLTWEEAFFVGGAMGWAYEEGFADGLRKRRLKKKTRKSMNNNGPL